MTRSNPSRPLARREYTLLTIPYSLRNSLRLIYVVLSGEKDLFLEMAIVFEKLQKSFYFI